ncbi:hypothetical protein GCM10029964_040770 [Kibdelosporangium lantanae]
MEDAVAGRFRARLVVPHAAFAVVVVAMVTPASAVAEARANVAHLLAVIVLPCRVREGQVMQGLIDPVGGRRALSRNRFRNRLRVVQLTVPKSCRQPSGAARFVHIGQTDEGDVHSPTSNI